MADRRMADRGTNKIGVLVDVLATVVGVAGLMAAGIVLTGGGRALGPVGSSGPVAGWQSLAQRGLRLGPATAPVTIIEFSDFQCPYCADAAGALRALRAKHGDRVALVYRHFPLQRLHPHAWTAALAAECAAEQNRFEAFHDALFDDQAAIGTRPWTDLAAAAGVLDTTRFRECVEQARYQHRVEQDIADGDRIGVAGTPTLLINGVRFRGTPSLGELEHHIARIR